MRVDLCSPPVPTRNFGFCGPRNLRLGVRCIVVDRESLKNNIILVSKSSIKHQIAKMFFFIYLDSQIARFHLSFYDFELLSNVNKICILKFLV